MRIYIQIAYKWPAKMWRNTLDKMLKLWHVGIPHTYLHIILNIYLDVDICHVCIIILFRWFYLLIRLFIYFE